MDEHTYHNCKTERLSSNFPQSSQFGPWVVFKLIIIIVLLFYRLTYTLQNCHKSTKTLPAYYPRFNASLSLFILY